VADLDSRQNSRYNQQIFYLHSVCTVSYDESFRESAEIELQWPDHSIHVLNMSMIGCILITATFHSMI